MAPLPCGETDMRLFTGVVITLGISMICPEYIAPLFVFGLFIYFKRHFSKTNRKAKIGELGKVFLVYMTFMLVSGIWSDSHYISSLIALLWMGCFLGYIIIANSVNSKEKLKEAITAVNISAGIIGFIAIFEFVTYNLTKHTDFFNFIFPNPLYYGINTTIFKYLPVDVVYSQFNSRASATFDNPLILATYLIITTPFCAFGSVYFKHSRNRKISTVCLIFAVAGVVATSSRGAYIALGLAIITMLISHKKIFKKLFPFVIGLAITVPIVIVLRYRNSPRKEDFLSSDTSRFEIWESCIEMFKQHPVFGLGAGTENIHILLRDTYGIDRTHAHNLALEMLTEGGIIGLAFCIAIIAVIVKNVIRLFKLKNNLYRPYAVLYTSSLVGFTVMSLFEFTLQSPKELMIFFILLGFIEATYRMATDRLQLAEDEVISYEEITEEDYEEEKEISV
ncbi:MAG: O-antigen ligase family protein [Eubacterium sp.]